MKLTEKQRKILRNIYRGLGVSAALITMQACDTSQVAMYGPAPMYGPPPDTGTNISITGKVLGSSTQNPIKGIQVSVKDQNALSALTYPRFTDNSGSFNINVPQKNIYSLFFEDVDGPLNGSYKTKKITITLSDTKMSFYIFLEENGN